MLNTDIKDYNNDAIYDDRREDFSTLLIPDNDQSPSPNHIDPKDYRYS